MIKMKGLGRGLDALLAGSDRPQGDEQRKLPVDRLKPGKYQPRTQMDEVSLAELAASIKAQGIMQPILVRPIDRTPGAERYEIVAGERRWRASQQAGLSEVPVLVRDIPDEQALAMAAATNSNLVANTLVDVTRDVGDAPSVILNNTVPEPESFALLGLGALGLLAARRRRA